MLQWMGRDMENTWMLFYTTSHLFWGWVKGSLPGLVWWREQLGFVSSWGGSIWIICLFLVPFTISILVLTAPYLIGVSSKLCLSQPMISNSFLHPIPRKKGEQVSSPCLESLSDSSELESTIPEPQQRCTKWKSWLRLMCLPPATWPHRGALPALRCTERGSRESCLPAPQLIAQWHSSPTSGWILFHIH